MVRILIGLKTKKTTTKSVHYMKIYEKVRPKLRPKYVQTTTKEDRNFRKLISLKRGPYTGVNDFQFLAAMSSSRSDDVTHPFVLPFVRPLATPSHSNFFSTHSHSNLLLLHIATAICPVFLSFYIATATYGRKNYLGPKNAKSC